MYFPGSEKYITIVSEPRSVLMDVEFHNGVYKILAQHESSLDQINATLQTIMTHLQALRITQFQKPVNGEINPFTPGESAHPLTNPKLPTPTP